MSNSIMAFPHDKHGRPASYLRLSVTDRCNLKCMYCTGRERQRHIPHERILRYEEFYRLVAIGERLGARKLRITGGEPFMRLDIMAFLQGLRQRFSGLQLALTTNGTLLDPFIRELVALDLVSVNISLDSFDRSTFSRITGSDSLPAAFGAIEKLLSLGQRVKINAVALAGVTDLQMADFIHAVKTMPVDIRFIEFMPMGANTLWDGAGFISCADLLRLASESVDLIPEPPDVSGLGGPARIFAIPGAKGRLGFISALSDHFCSTCNRLRITSAGLLRTCLFSDGRVDLSRLLRNPRIADRNIAHAICAALAAKPIGSELLGTRTGAAVAGCQMIAIGG